MRDENSIPNSIFLKWQMYKDIFSLTRTRKILMILKGMHWPSNHIKLQSNYCNRTVQINILQNITFRSDQYFIILCSDTKLLDIGAYFWGKYFRYSLIMNWCIVATNSLAEGNLSVLKRNTHCSGSLVQVRQRAS